MIFLGIDGGGSKTAFLLEDADGAPLARLETGPSNWLSAGADAARQAIADGISRLPATPDVVSAGFAGAGRPAGIDFYRSTLESLLPHARVFVETDAFIAYMGAIGIQPGVLLIAGTGSIVIARNAAGQMFRVGGWGPVFGDEGGGFWMGREAVRTALRAEDAKTFPHFVAAISAGLGLNSIRDAIPAWAAGKIDVRSVAALAGGMIPQFPAEPCARILRDAAVHLRSLVEDGTQQAGLTSNYRKAAVGSIGTHPRIQELIGLDFQTPVAPPERGAILWARARILKP